MDLSQYISIEPSLCPNCWNVWFDTAAAFAAGAVKRGPIVPSVPRESAFHIERTGNGNFVCDDDGLSAFSTQHDAELFAIAATIAYHTGK